MRALARHWLWLHEEIITPDKELECLVAERAPALMVSHDIATLTIAEMLILVGDDPTRIIQKRPLQNSVVFVPFLRQGAEPTASD